jgi:hypothetical protein
MECGNTISNITQYTKRVLLDQGQVMRSAERKPFQVYCPTCSTKRDVELVDGGKAAKCSSCKGDLNLSGAFIHTLNLREKENAQKVATEQPSSEVRRVIKTTKKKTPKKKKTK